MIDLMPGDAAILGFEKSGGEVADEVEAAPSDLREFLSREIATLLDQPRFLDTIDGTVVGFGRGGTGSGSGDADRVDEVVLPRLHALAAQ